MLCTLTNLPSVGSEAPFICSETIALVFKLNLQQALLFCTGEVQVQRDYSHIPHLQAKFRAMAPKPGSDAAPERKSAEPWFPMQAACYMVQRGPKTSPMRMLATRAQKMRAGLSSWQNLRNHFLHNPIWTHLDIDTFQSAVFGACR